MYRRVTGKKSKRSLRCSLPALERQLVGTIVEVQQEIAEVTREVQQLNVRGQSILTVLNSAIGSTINLLRGTRKEYELIVEGAADAIYVMFYDSSVYRYEASRIGDGALGETIRLGEGNSGLVRFIHAHVKYDYS